MSLQNKTVLICDDSILVRKQLKDIISGCGISHIIEASDGSQAVELYKEHKPDLAFLDIIMPIKDGSTATAEIVAFDPNATVVIVSSIGTQGLLKQTVEAGAKDFVQKPFTASQIQKVISSRLEES